MTKNIFKYCKVLWERIYRPVKPVVNPLLKKIKLIHVLIFLLSLGLAGSLWFGWQVRSTERASRWPWSARSRAEMSLVFFEAGDEEKAMKELEMANKLLVLRSKENLEAVRKAGEKVTAPEKIKQEIKSFEKVLEEKPYYRDVLLRLSLLNYQIYEDEKSKEYFERASYLDPNNQEVLEVKEIISSLL
ncbi:tetratricopeptide repeat protein [Patescibacteria group bacterium]